MELEDKHQQLTRWIDGEFSAEDRRAFEAAAEGDAHLLAAKLEAERLRHLLQADMPARPIPNPEFFNSQVQRRIADGSAAPSPTSTGTYPARAGGGILSWFRSPFTLASAAAVIALGLFALSQRPDGSAMPGHTLVASTYTPDRGIGARDFYSDAAAATVIMLDGLAALPDSIELKGQNVVSAAPGSPNELYNEAQELAFVVIQGADSVPVIRSF